VTRPEKTKILKLARKVLTHERAAVQDLERGAMAVWRHQIEADRAMTALKRYVEGLL